MNRESVTFYARACSNICNRNYCFQIDRLRATICSTININDFPVALYLQNLIVATYQIINEILADWNIEDAFPCVHINKRSDLW